MALVQSRSATQAAGPATQVLAFSSSITAGNTIMVVGGSDIVVDVLTISDGVNVYSPLAAIQNTGIIGLRIFMFSEAISVAAGATSITLGGLTGASMLAIHEFSGSINAFDVSHSSSGIGNSQDSGGVLSSFASETLFGFIAGAPNSVTSISPGAGWTAAESSTSSNGFAFITEYRIVSSVGTYNATSSTTTGKGGNFDWAAEIATFRQATAALSSDWQLGGRHRSSRIILPGRGIDA